MKSATASPSSELASEPALIASHYWWVVALIAFVLGFAFAALLLAAASPARAEAARPGLFGYKERRSEDLRPFTKWTGTLDRYFSEPKSEDASCKSTLFNRCHLSEWKRFLAGLRGRDRMTQVREVNAFMNRAPYIVDPVNYGVPDYWATPRQFLAKNGDCEDYAIAKYLSLRALGVPAEEMRVVVLFDTNLHLAHAVLAVYQEGQAFVLDNQARRVVSADRIHHYRPVYSINENAWWIHSR